MVLVYLSMIEGPEERNKFEIVYQQYKSLMYYVAYRILREERDAEDAVHNAFVRIAEHIDKISEPVCPKTRAFVVLIVERTAINEYNHQRRRRGLPLEEEALGAAGAWAPEGPEEGDAVARAIAALPDRDRELILLKHWQGFSDREIAGLLGMKPGAVSRALQRAKEKLRERLREEGNRGMKDALDELLDRYAPDAGAMWLAAETPDIVPEHPFSSKFRRRMERLIRRQGRSPAVTAALRCARRAAAYALVLLTLSFSCLMTVDASFREQMLRVVVEVLQEFTEFRYTSDLPANGQPGEVRFTYLPEGMEEQYREQDAIEFYVYYESPDGDCMDLSQIAVSDGTSVSIGLDTENADVTYFTVRGCEAMKIVKSLDHTIHWTEGDSIYTLYGTVPMEELEKVAEGIQIVG